VINTVHAYSDWYYYMVMNPVDRIQTVWIRPDPDPTRSWKNTGYLAGSGSRSRSGAPLATSCKPRSCMVVDIGRVVCWILHNCTAGHA